MHVRVSVYTHSCACLRVCLSVKCVFVQVWRGSHAFLFSRNKQKNVHIRTLMCEHPSVAHSLYFLRYIFLEGTQVMCLMSYTPSFV